MINEQENSLYVDDSGQPRYIDCPHCGHCIGRGSAWLGLPTNQPALTLCCAQCGGTLSIAHMPNGLLLMGSGLSDIATLSANAEALIAAVRQHLDAILPWAWQAGYRTARNDHAKTAPCPLPDPNNPDQLAMAILYLVELSVDIPAIEKLPLYRIVKNLASSTNQSAK